MLPIEEYDADEILKEPSEEDDFFNTGGEDEVLELDFGGSRTLSDIDLAPEDEEDLYL